MKGQLGRMGRMKKPARQSKKAKKSSNGMIDFDYANVSYQIDPTRRKVYHRWIEVETAKTCMIMGAYTQSQGAIKRAV
jgi:hypothetical protein